MIKYKNLFYEIIKVNIFGTIKLSLFSNWKEAIGCDLVIIALAPKLVNCERLVWCVMNLIGLK